MNKKLFDSELRVMEVLWDRGEATAKYIAAALGETVGWSKTTAYTVIKKCVDKGAIERVEPNFLCRPLITREQARARETGELVERFYGGDKSVLVASLLDGETLTEAELASLKRLVDGMK